MTRPASRRRRRVLSTAVLLAALPAAWAQEPDVLELDDFEIHQYVGSLGFSPLAVMRLDSNPQVLMACRRGCTRAELAGQGIEALESQIVLLRAMRMLSQDGKRLQTRVPLLDGEAAGRLRAATAALAPEILKALRGEVESLRGALAERGFADHAYAILFSYVLDGMAWEFFEEYGELRPRQLSASSPHWAGEIWGIYPPRESAAGTAVVVAGELSIKITGTGAATPRLEPVTGAWRDLRELLRRHGSGDPASEIGERFAPFGLVDAGGAVAVPVITERPGDEIFELAASLTEKVTEAARSELDLEALQSELGLRDRAQTLILAYHELMWDLMDTLEDAGLAPRPRLLEDPQAAAPQDVAALTFVVDRRRGEKPERADEPREDEEDG